MHHRLTRFFSVTVALLSAPAVWAADAPMGDEDIIATALSAGPPQLRADATVVAPDGRVLQEGTNGFTCMLTPAGGAPMCAEETWMPWADAWVNNKDYDPASIQGVGIAYMLAGDTEGGGASNIDPMAKAPTDDNEWVIEGPHVMLIGPDASLFAHLPTDPNMGGPYVMWRGTPFAHVMLPTGPRPAAQTAEMPDGGKAAQ